MAESQSFVVVGNPENRRIAFFREAVAKSGHEFKSLVSYKQLLEGDADLSDCLSTDILRIESPGEDFEVERALLARGSAAAESEGAPFISPDAAWQLAFDRGLILHPRQWFLGFREILFELEEAIDTNRAKVMNHPAEIAIMFDKIDCQQKLARAGIPVAPFLEPVSCFEELLSEMDDAGERRVFVKLAHGSSASGVVALERNKNAIRAITTAELVRSDGEVRLYNSLKLRHYTEVRDIEDLLNRLCRERVHVERWLPKATLDGEQFDLRVVVIAGQAKHVVVRQSQSPFTNLHLGNRRGDVGEFLKRVGSHWESVKETCAKVMSQFPRSLYAGVDVVVSPRFDDHVVLEVNAFGDLLPGITHDDMDTYTAEVVASVR